ncbi:hypothetical protein ACFQZS_06995 [Mucilaginibacter calamicampi]|uniref:Lipoprotein n=1 Tax=Mucilaginibacter calamicampi TaxID=1302352 RepID=A0ABW2YU76_9SPHI
MKKIYIIILCTLLSSCLFESPSDLNVTIINNSKNKVYVGQAFYSCDSCGIMKDVRLYCSHGNDTTFFPQLLNAGETTIMRTKMHDIQKMNVINADSLEEYCKKGLDYNIMNKPWVKILTERVDLQKKTCTITIQ